MKARRKMEEHTGKIAVDWRSHAPRLPTPRPSAAAGINSALQARASSITRTRGTAWQTVSALLSNVGLL